MNFQCFVIYVLRGWYAFNWKAFLVIIIFSVPVNIEELNPSGLRNVPYNDKDFKISCVASGSNIEEVVWYKDNQPLDYQYFQIWDIKTMEGNYEYEQIQKLQSVIGRKLDGKL